MPRTFEVRYDLPVDVETAYAAISGEQWAPAKAAALNDGSRQVSRVVGDGGAVTLVVSRSLPDGIPGIFSKLLPADGRVTQTDSWGPSVDGVRAGTWKVETPGSPADVHGTMALQPTGEGCAYVVKGSAKVSVPLLGGKAEDLIVTMTGKLTAKEVDVLRSLVG